MPTGNTTEVNMFGGIILLYLFQPFSRHLYNKQHQYLQDDVHK